ncbi:dihydrofolate reductase family protein [Williamsia sp. CHRR-6]|uniref:dihydrofolate reductase family protein n=1 Tax=Williamsia sp. CHRR-6 TaxID=2835871 RepID=UPI001BD93FA7|nr:dihydrofolate reductase family protein [Williamsia sp. CHRR-6]MBT0565563.1 dihydrofolate reductase family protein [Williamsia sp. CHRR-6]
MSRTRVHNLFVSSDGYAAGNRVTFDAPIGDARALFSKFDGRVIHGINGIDDPVTVDRALFSMWGQGIGAEIMGRRKFGPQTGPWPDDGWAGWWGDEPPFRTPVFVLTHHRRPPIEFDNGTSFHFIDANAQDAVTMAQHAAGGLDVRLGGGPSSIRQFLQADLVDFLHLAIVPVVLGAGVRLFDDLVGLEDRFTVETIGTTSGLTHQLWNRTPRGTTGI